LIVVLVEFGNLRESFELVKDMCSLVLLVVVNIICFINNIHTRRRRTRRRRTILKSETILDEGKSVEPYFTLLNLSLIIKQFVLIILNKVIFDFLINLI